MTAEKALSPTALNYELIGPMMRDIALLNFEGKLQTAVDQRDPQEPPPRTPSPAVVENPRLAPPDQVLHFGTWDAPVWFGPVRRFEATQPPPPPPPPPPNGRALVAQLGENQFLVTGLYSRIGFLPAGPVLNKPWQYLSVEEGRYENGAFKPSRILNGDQTDWGLIFGANPTVLRVTLYLR
jgi:hypothetical protein